MKLGFVKAVTTVVADSWRYDESYVDEMFGSVTWIHTPVSAVWMNRVTDRGFDNKDFYEMRFLMNNPEFSRA